MFSLVRRCTAGQRQLTNNGFLPVSLSEYLRLLDWTGRQARPDKRGAIPGELAPILSRLQLSVHPGLSWVGSNSPHFPPPQLHWRL